MKIPLAFISPDAYERPDICTPCGGVCCKRMPGITLPIDWGAPDEETMTRRLTEALASGKWAIDWWEGDPTPGSRSPYGIPYDDDDFDPDNHPLEFTRISRGYFVRPAVKEEEGRTFHPTWGGECTMLTPTGCSLGKDARPTQCRGVVPHGNTDPEDGKPICNGIATSDDKQSYAIAWLPYHALIMKCAK